MYLAIGEVESIGSRDPEMQLASGTLEMLAKRKITMVLTKCNLDCSVFLGICSWGERGYGNTTCKGVNRASSYQLEEMLL